MVTKSSKPKSSKQVCVVLDTNVLISKRLLRTPIGRALLSTLKRLNGKLGLPEVVESELLKNVVKVGFAAASKVSNNLETVQTLLGHPSSYKSPTKQDFQKSVNERLEELSDLIRRVPFGFEHAKKALERVIDGTPPNYQNNQQFKDSAIWEAVLDLAKKYNVFFITADKGFFEDRDPSKGLAKCLLEELQNKQLNVTIFDKINTCLESLEEITPPIPTKDIVSSIDMLINDKLKNIAAKHIFVLVSLSEYAISAFPMSKHGLLAITYSIEYTLREQMEPAPQLRYEPNLAVIGECLYNLESKIISDNSFDVIETRWLTGEGEVINPKELFRRVSGTLKFEVSN